MASPEHIAIEHDPQTGPRLKYYSHAADVDYWTSMWRHAALEHSYAREQRGHFPQQLRSTFLRWVEPGGRVLEAGCGLGDFTVAAHARGFRAEGLDWSEPTICRLRERFPAIPWHVGDVRRLQFQDGEFDGVYSPGVCEHFVEGPTAILLETARVLRPGGIAVISTPCFNTWLQRHTELFCRSVPSHAAFYQYAFTPEGLGQLLARLGFELLQVRPYGALTNMVSHAGWRPPRRVAKALAVAMDYTPKVRDWGQSCLWIARRP